MSLPTPREPRHGSARWEIVRYALGNNARTIRFCAIWLVMTGGPAAGYALAELIRHIQLPVFSGRGLRR